MIIVNFFFSVLTLRITGGDYYENRLRKQIVAFQEIISDHMIRALWSNEWIIEEWKFQWVLNPKSNQMEMSTIHFFFVRKEENNRSNSEQWVMDGGPSTTIKQWLAADRTFSFCRLLILSRKFPPKTSNQYPLWIDLDGKIRSSF